MNHFYPDGKISRDHGNLIKAGNYYIYPVYHPAAALRSTSVLEEFKKDFARIPEMLTNAEELIKGGELGSNIGITQEDVDGQLGLGL